MDNAVTDNETLKYRILGGKDSVRHIERHSWERHMTFRHFGLMETLAGATVFPSSRLSRLHSPAIQASMSFLPLFKRRSLPRMGTSRSLPQPTTSDIPLTPLTSNQERFHRDPQSSSSKKASDKADENAVENDIIARILELVKQQAQDFNTYKEKVDTFMTATTARLDHFSRELDGVMVAASTSVSEGCPATGVDPKIFKPKSDQHSRHRFSQLDTLGISPPHDTYLDPVFSPTNDYGFLQDTQIDEETMDADDQPANHETDKDLNTSSSIPPSDGPNDRSSSATFTEREASTVTPRRATPKRQQTPDDAKAKTRLVPPRAKDKAPNMTLAQSINANTKTIARKSKRKLPLAAPSSTTQTSTSASQRGQKRRSNGPAAVLPPDTLKRGEGKIRVKDAIWPKRGENTVRGLTVCTGCPTV